MTVFDDATDTLFADRNLATDATYRAGGLGSGTAVRTIIARRLREAPFGDTGAIVYDISAAVRVSEIDDPRRGDTIQISSPSGVAGTFEVKAVIRDMKGLQSRLLLGPIGE